MIVIEEVLRMYIGSALFGMPMTKSVWLAPVTVTSGEEEASPMGLGAISRF